jgi:2-methylcitrate dehydratase PrpD
MEDLSLQICRTVSRWRYEDLPPAVVDTAKRFLIDTLGVIGGARRAPGVQEVHARLGKWESGGSATALLTGQRLSPPSAALANGTAAHALDFDDQHDPARVHTNCVVLPALLATAEDAAPILGKDFLLALVIGAELHARLGLACYNSLGKGWHPTMVHGTPSAAIACGRLLGLKDEALGNALGMAYHQTSGSAQSMRDGALSKRIGAGFAARAAVLGAFLGADGLSSTRNTFQGSAGLIPLYERDEFRESELMGGLGEQWRVLEYSFKPHPCCRCNHTAIGIGIDLYNDGLRAADVESAEILLGEVNWMTVGGAYEAARNDPVHAQFNAAYCFARALTDGRVDLDSFRRPAITDAPIPETVARIDVRTDPSIDKTAIEPARILLRTKDGRTLEIYRDAMKGSPADPLSDAALVDKFRTCLRFGLDASPAQSDRLLTAIRNLDQAEDAAEALVSAFPAAPAALAKASGYA